MFVLLIVVSTPSLTQQREYGPLDQDTCDRLARGISIANDELSPNQIWSACFEQ